MVRHLIRIVGVIILLVLLMFYPFFPGGYDGLAVTLSTMAQLIGLVGLLLVPIGILWLVYELRKRARRKRSLPNGNGSYTFALVSLVVASLVAVTVSVVAFASAGRSLGLIAFVLWVYVVSRLIPRIGRLKNAETQTFNPAPVYLVFVPLAALLFQVLFAKPAAEFSRNAAITNSAEMIHDIEMYRIANGRYPTSLSAAWGDYDTSIAGIRQYHYKPNGDAYDLFFEQPLFLVDNFGAREFVVYNPLNEQAIISHDSWILILSPEELGRSQGWFAVNDTEYPHWKTFWFD